MPGILKNDAAEEMLLDIRAGHHAAEQSVTGRRGAFLIFTTAVVTSGRAGAQLVYPLASDTEPGVLVTTSGQAQISGAVAGITVSGTFSWTLSGGDLPPARYRFYRRGCEVPPPPWATQLPQSQPLVTEEPPRLAQRQARVLRRGRDAENRLLWLSERVVRHACRGALSRALRYRPAVDVDDLVQRALQTAVRLLPVYASPARPPCSWLGMLRLDGRRDMYRELSRLDWLPSDAADAVALAEACGVCRFPDSAVTLIALSEAARRRGLRLPRLGPRQLDAALAAPAALAHETLATSLVDGPESLDWEPEAMAATVARLVTHDARLIALAALGDPVAVADVGQRVARRFVERGDSPSGSRHRCWEQFRASGQLFTSPRGLARFAGMADPACLAALDHRLCQAAGVSVGAER